MSSVETRLTRSLSVLAAVDVAGGLLLRRSSSPLVRGFGRQTALWGEVDGAIAAVGALRRRSRGPTDPARLRRVLLVNAGLDVAYVLGGAALARRGGTWRGADLRGDGLAVVVQGLALLVLDSAYARRLRA